MSSDAKRNPFAPPHKALVPRSRRDYEVILVVNPGAEVSGAALAVLNSDNSCYYVSGRTTWKELMPFLSRVDVFIGCWWNEVEKAHAESMALDAEVAGCKTYIKYAEFGQVLAGLPTRPRRAARTLQNFFHPRGIICHRQGPFKLNYFKVMAPREGTELLG